VRDSPKSTTVGFGAGCEFLAELVKAGDSSCEEEFGWGRINAQKATLHAAFDEEIEEGVGAG
jgi:hypothetical protein